ncbi:hypothetical protein PMAYCL1PPCAC_15419, partial [Pristionchus mayeri]
KKCAREWLVMDRLEDSRSCLVCSVSITSVHLGMDICRACASFYKRAKMTGVVYPCRQGTRLCDVTHETKFTCRRCRFDKCLAVGVVYDGPMRIRAKPALTLLQRIHKEFKSTIERRRAKELEFIRTCPDCFEVPHPREKIFIVRAHSSFDLINIAISESRVFFDNVFIAMKHIADQEIDIIFKDYMIKLGIVFSYFMTMKIWGSCDNKLMSTVTTCYDNEVPLDFYYPEEHGDKDAFKR